MELKQPYPQRLNCWRCGAYPATTVKPWRLYLLNHHKRKNNDHALGQITTVDMPLCPSCAERLRKSKQTGWIVALVAFAAGFILCIALALAGVLQGSMREIFIIGVVIGFIPALIAWSYYTKTIRRKYTGFHPKNLERHPVFGFFHDYGWTDSHLNDKSPYHPRRDDEYRVNYVTYLRWLQYNYGYQIIDDSRRVVDLTTPEFAGQITPEQARRVSISFTTDTTFRTKNVHNLRQSQM